jgi:hypothetical protein
VSIIHCSNRAEAKLSQLKTALFEAGRVGATPMEQSYRSVACGDAIVFREEACGGVRRLKRPAQWEHRLPLAY